MSTVKILLLCATLLVAGCTARGVQDEAADEPGRTDAAPSAERDSTLRTAYQADIGSFDPDDSFEVAALGAINAVYEGLVEYEPGSTELAGLLAESWDVSDDGLVYNFELREGVQFHDGEALDAEAVLASFERRQREDLTLSYFLWNVTEMDAPDERTFTLTLGMPQPSFLDNLASPWGPKVVSPAALEEHGADSSFFDESAVGTGPFELEEFARGQRYVLQRFDDYWGDTAHFEEIHIAVQPDVGQQVLALQNGDLDVVLHGYPYQQLEALPQGLVEFTYQDLGLQMAYINTSGVLADEPLRAAVVAAADPTDWISDAFSGRAEPAASLFPRVMIEPDAAWSWPSEAEQVDDGSQLQVVYAAEETAVQQRVAELLIARLSAVGIDANARAVPGDELLTWMDDPASAPADIVLVQNNPDSAHPETFAGLFFATGAPLNVFGHSNEEADALFEEGASADDVDERDRLYLEGAQIVFEEGAFLPLADVEHVIVHHDGLADLDPRPAIPWNIDLASVRWE